MDLRNAGRLMVFLWFLTETATKCVQRSQVSVSVTNTGTEQQVKLTCSNACNLIYNPTYVWYRNGQRINTLTSISQIVEDYSINSYSCAVKDHEDLHSPTVCSWGQTCFEVSYTHQSVCVLKGTTVELPCKYQYPASHNILEANWYIQDKPNAAPTNLSLVPGYANRVEFVGRKDTDCTLRITDLRETDSAEYKFRFKTQYGEWGYSFPGTTLNVTDLQVKVTPASEGRNVILTCTTICTLTDKPNFIWFKTGQILTTESSQEISVMSYYTYSYSCAVKGHDNLRSPTVCVLGHSCFDVIYTHQSICAVKGLAVDLLCTYQYPRTQNLSEANWYIQKKPNGALTTLSLFSGYENRMQFDKNKAKDCTLRITDLRESDSAEYKFRFKTQYGEWGFSLPGTTLYVTDLQVKLSRLSGNVTLICSTTCTLTDNPTFVWYKNGQHLTNPTIQNNYLYIKPFSREDAGSYSCAVKTGNTEVRSPALTVGEHTFVMKAVFGITVGLILLVSLSGFLWFRKKEPLFVSHRSTSDTQNAAEKTQEDCSPVYVNITRLTMIPTVPQTSDSDEEDEHLYANTHFSSSKTQDVDVYSNVQLAQVHLPDEDEQDDGYYGNIHFTCYHDVPLYSTTQLPQPQIPDEDDESCYIDADTQ
ncbi:hypothetical protein UPYG_G00109340 [Umbra pygmaea]|uniref:Ig-like domain-containing protein n=1 Tax=Umbra pygmaea TaxID=75934 RepID=A0ABD0XS83_UMBPY